MALTINTNVASLYAQASIARTSEALGKSFERLSSGYRINSAADDAAGLALSEGLSSYVRSFAVAERNTNNAISMTQVAEAGLGQVSGILIRMRELAVQGSNGDLTTTDRSFLETEFGQLKTEIDRIAKATKFNSIDLLGSTVNSVAFQVGILNNSNNVVTVNFGGISLSTLSVEAATLTGATGANAQSAITSIDSGLVTVSTLRSGLGASMNRLTATVANTATMRTNMAAANSRIRDVDVAEESARLARNQVLMQAGMAILAQANAQPQMAVRLIG